MATSAIYLGLENGIFWGTGDVHVLMMSPVSVISRQSGWLYDGLIGRRWWSMRVFIWCFYWCFDPTDHFWRVWFKGLALQYRKQQDLSSRFKVCKPWEPKLLGNLLLKMKQWRWKALALDLSGTNLGTSYVSENYGKPLFWLRPKKVVRILQPVMWISSVNIQIHRLNPIL